MRSCVQLVVAALLVLAVDQSAGIKCWTCRSDDNKACGDPFHNETLSIKDCRYEIDHPSFPGLRPTICQKMTQEVRGEMVTFRSCGWPHEQRGNCSYTSFRSRELPVECYSCERDGCNGAPLPVLPSLVVGLVPLAALFFTILRV